MSRFFTALAAILAFTYPLVAQQPRINGKTSLDEYIQKPDPAYQWKVAKTIPGNSSSTTIIHLQSQSWLNEKKVDKPVWQHWLVIAQPKVLKTKKAFLMISGGANNSPMPEAINPMLALIAQETGSIVAELRMVPNQPLVFHNDGIPRKEDDLIGYTWDQFLKTGDGLWPARLPMVKSAVRAMDCIQEWALKDQIKVDGFVVAGGSKRGWTTWMTAAVDKRVVAILPIVIDILKVDPSIRHHAEVYGFWARAIGDYYAHQILQRHDHPRLKALYDIEDPYFYRDRFTIPKYILNSTGDQFFCPDSSQFYFDDLPGEKLLRYFPNADHSLRDTEVAQNIIAFYQMIIDNQARPKYSWSFEKDGSIRVKSGAPVRKALLWQATNAKARDFRLVTIGKTYTSKEVKPAEDGSYTARIDTPMQGWTAFFLELEFDSEGKFPLKATTAVRILPDTLPYRGIDLKKVPYEGLLEKPKPVSAAPKNEATPHVTVYAEPGRFGGWPANHGLWAWGNEILVGFSAGFHKDLGLERHSIDREKPEEHLLARSLDGGLTWKIENPSTKGSLIPSGKGLHGITPPGLKEPEWADCPGGVDFTHPDFALTARMTSTTEGPSRFSYSLDRGKNWLGPFRLPLFNTPGIAARTDYLVNGKHDCTLFLTAAKANGKEGRPLCVRTTDGGKSWKFLSWIGQEPEGYGIMPSTVRLGENELLTTIRCRLGKKSWIDAYRTKDGGHNWIWDQTAVADTGEGNPPSMIRLKDERICLTYGYRAAPFGMRAKISADQGKTWGPEILLRGDGGGRDVGYPRSVQRPDGKIVTVYYFHDTLKGERYITATIWSPG
ncbi:MAG: hypothetical protein EXR99_15725 [Gemmataceae bacterium]|nr:hypothetical protein [Gemmataceae bacterium]